MLTVSLSVEERQWGADWTLSVSQKVYKHQSSNVMVRMFFHAKMADSVMCRCLDVKNWWQME